MLYRLRILAANRDDDASRAHLIADVTFAFNELLIARGVERVHKWCDDGVEQVLDIHQFELCVFAIFVALYYYKDIRHIFTNIYCINILCKNEL